MAVHLYTLFESCFLILLATMGSEVCCFLQSLEKKNKRNFNQKISFDSEVFQTGIK